uniref:Protein TIFY n=1 Tax=Oryza meridionalis TaxID=40149 RepID=A0A0E0D157_9ORYZ
MSTTRAPVELDFLGLRAADADDRHAAKSISSSSSSIRGMETSAIARIGPHLLRRVIAAAGPPPPPSTAPVPEEMPGAAAAAAAAPMTLFYNGSVAVFDVSHDKAEAIMRMATEATKAKGLARGNAIVGNFAKEPLTRTKSLQRFLSKRKERLTSLGPYQVGGPAAVGATTATTTKSFLAKEEEHTAS